MYKFPFFINSTSDYCIEYPTFYMEVMLDINIETTNAY